MRKTISRLIALMLLMLMTAASVTPAALADAAEDPVQAVIAQLEAIDTLQQMQAKRYTFSVKNNHYDTGTTDEAVMAEHETARAGYEAYVSEMFAARAAAQIAYDALTAEEQAQIDSSLVAKLSDSLSNSFAGGTFVVTPADDEYTFEAVDGGVGYGYEVSNHMVSGNIPQTFILVDTSDGKTSWTPSGLYKQGESNYDVAYCCDVLTGLEYSTDYKRVNLEDSSYYGENAASHIRAILQNAYPFVSVEQMKANLKAGGLSSSFVDSLSREDLISAVQMAVWTYANAADGASGGLGYYATVNVPKNTGIYFTPLHDYTNETWYWQPGKRQRSYDARAEYRVNTLAYYLCNLPGVAPSDDQLVITDVEVTRADLIEESDDVYRVGMYVCMDYEADAKDDLIVRISSADAEGNVTESWAQRVDGRKEMELTVKAKAGDTIIVTVEGTQHVARGVYFYEPEGGRDVSQSLVGVGEGYTRVSATESFTFSGDVSQGLRIYKTAVGTTSPLSEITFHVYQGPEGGAYSEIPTEEEIALYATAENLVGSVTTDSTGYAALGLDEGIYLVVEEHNAEKVVAPVDPFYIQIPMTVSVASEDGSTTAQTMSVVSVYPKNEPTTPP